METRRARPRAETGKLVVRGDSVDGVRDSRAADRAAPRVERMRTGLYGIVGETCETLFHCSG